MNRQIAFIGGGNMASAIINGMVAQGFAKDQIIVVEPWQEARDRLNTQFGLQTHEAAGAFLSQADIVVWAVKPQSKRIFSHPARCT